MLLVDSSREYLTHIEEEKLIEWWSAVLRAHQDPERIELLRQQFVARGFPAQTSEVKHVLSTAKEQLMDEFKRRGIALPS